MIARWTARIAVFAIAALLLTNTSWAYYYYTYFNSTSPPYTPIVARFDLNTLNNNTVPFFLSSAGPSVMYPGDSVAGILSQINAAANVWNGVNSSSIRLAYGGFYNPGATESAPGIQIEFSDDIPPGLLAVSIPTIVGGFAKDSSGNTFLPIYLSLMELPTNLPDYFNGPSYSEEFFVTLVHEFGHTLGLQHTLASGVMSTYTTTASTKADPLGADDIAGISLLYPAGNYLSTVGSISGTVTMNGAGVNLASVVAITPNTQAITTLTNPDGTFQLNGIPTGVKGAGIDYYVYVHPLPAPVEGESGPDNIYLPKNSNGDYLAANTGFATLFYPGTQDYSAASLVKVTPGAYGTPVSFSVNPVSSPGVSSVRTYSYLDSTYVIGSPVLYGSKTTLAANGVDLLEGNNSNNVLTPGLGVGLLGSGAQVNNVRPYPPGNPYIAIDVMPAVTSEAGSARLPMHLLFSTPGNLYILPSGFSVVDALPPTITAVGPAVDPNGNPAVQITGTQFTSNTQVWFDGQAGTVQSQTNTTLIVTPPPAPAGYTAAVVALNTDGQSSLSLNATAPTYTYTSGPSFVAPTGASVTVSPSVIPAGGQVTVQVIGSNTNFIQGVTTVGFGTSDVQVNQVSVTDATHMTVTVTPNVSISSANITITTGLDMISQALGSQVTAIDPSNN